MNRTLLLENLPDLLEDLDARLTALEAKQAKRPMAINLETALDESQSEVERLTAELAARTADRDNLAAGVGRLTDEVKRLETVCDDLSDKLDAANCR